MINISLFNSLLFFKSQHDQHECLQRQFSEEEVHLEWIEHIECSIQRSFSASQSIEQFVCLVDRIERLSSVEHR